MVWNGMERKFRMEYGRCQNGMEDFKNGMEKFLFVVPYQFHTKFCIVFAENYLPLSGGDKHYCPRSIQLQHLRVLFVDKSQYFGCLYAQTVYVLHHCKYITISSIDVIVDNFDRLDFFSFFLRLTICQVLGFVFLHRRENSYLLFLSRFSLLLFIFLVFQLTIILFGVKAWYFYCGKCSLAVWL